MVKFGSIVPLALAVPLGIGGVVYIVKNAPTSAYIPKDLKEFKETPLGGCAVVLFGFSDRKEEGVETASKEKKVNELFSNQGVPAKGCLVINWEKETYADKKGKGNFRFFWAMKRGDDGFVVFTKGEADGKDTSKIKWEGVAYTLEKENKKGKLSKKHEVTEKAMTSENMKAQFPITGEEFTGFDDGTSFGFINPKDDSDKLCDDKTCAGEPQSKSSFEGFGSWDHASQEEESTAKTADAGSKNFDDGWDAIYTKDVWDMKEVVGEVKGNWKNVINSISKPASPS